MALDTVIVPDGEYEVDLSGLFCSNPVADVFGIRYGFRPETIDDSYSSLLVKDSADDLYILRTEAKENAKAITSNAHIGIPKQEHILFDGKLPQSTTIKTKSRSKSLSSPSKGGTTSNPANLAKGLGITNPYSTPLAMSSLSDFILMYDDVANKFRMERFSGVIKMNKSREPDVLENRLVDIKKRHRTKPLDKKNGFIPSLVDSLLQSSKPDDAPTISYTQSINQISFPKRTHSHSRVPSQADDSVHIRSCSSQTTQKPVISRTPSRTSTQTCSLSDSGTSTATRIRKQKQRPKKSKLLRAAKRALSKSPKVKMARLIPVENINAKPVKGGISVPISKSPKIVPKESPGELSDDEEEESTSSQSTEHVMSDQDLADFADDLEEELDEDNKTDEQLPVSRNIDDVMEKSTGGGSTQGDDLRLDFSDLENAVEESPDDSVDEDGDGKGFQVVVEDNPRLMKSQRRVSESRISSLSDTSFPLSPLPKRPISMRKLAVSGNLMSRGSTPLGVSSPRISIDTPMLESGASSPSSSPPSKESARAEEVEDDTPDDDIEFDEEELDRALDDLDDEVSEAE